MEKLKQQNPARFDLAGFCCILIYSRLKDGYLFAQLRVASLLKTGRF